MTLDNPRTAKALKIGEAIPSVLLQDTDGQTVNLHHRLQRSRLLLIFYRGEW